MPQIKSGHRSAGRPSKLAAQSTTKVSAPQPVPRIAAKAASKSPLPKLSTSAAPPATDEKAPAIPAKSLAKPAKSHPVQPAKRKATRRKSATATLEAESATPLKLQPIAEPEFDFWRSSTAQPPASEESSVLPVDPQASAPAHLPPASAFVAALAFEADAIPAVAKLNAEPPAESVEPPAAPAIAEPLHAARAKSSNRRRTKKSIFELRMADNAAKERRQEPEASQPSDTLQPTNAEPVSPDLAMDSAASAAIEAAAVPAETLPAPKWEPKLQGEDKPLHDRRVGDRRANYSNETLKDAARRADQQTLFHETALWMRKSGSALIGLNVLLVIVVLFLWHSRSAPAPSTEEMQRATAAQMAEMHRATDASEVAAYAACLGSQTARNMLMQMKAGGPTSRILPPSTALQNSTARSQAAQIEFDLEKDTNVSVHMPVLFHVGVENIGKSQALNTRMWGEVKVVDSGKEPDFKYAETAFSKEAISPSDPTAKLVLFSVDGAGMVTPLNDATYQRINSGSAYVVAYGKVQYQDIFGARHWANFCRDITQPTGARRHNRCAAYNSTGVLEAASAPRAAHDGEKGPQQQTASMTLPEIACVVPKDQKN